MKRETSGFTLMEMLIVVAIIAILAAVAIPVFSAQLEKAREATCLANRRSLQSEVIAGYVSGQYASCDAAFAALCDKDNYVCPDGGTFSWDSGGEYGAVKCSEHGADENAKTAAEFISTWSQTVASYRGKSAGDCLAALKTSPFSGKTATFSGDSTAYNFSYNSGWGNTTPLLFANTYGDSDWKYPKYAQYIYNSADGKWYKYVGSDKAGYATTSIVNQTDAYNALLSGMSADTANWKNASGVTISAG